MYLVTWYHFWLQCESCVVFLRDFKVQLCRSVFEHPRSTCLFLMMLFSYPPTNTKASTRSIQMDCLSFESACVSEWSDYVWLNNVYVIKAVARRGHLVWVCDRRSATPASVLPSHSSGSSACVSHYSLHSGSHTHTPHTHTHRAALIHTKHLLNI